MRPESPEARDYLPWIVGILSVVFVIATLIANWYYLVDDSSNRGTFGDMFGGANALFSGLAFLGVIVAILLQRKELELQRKELEQTREELRGQKEQQIAQNNTLRKQNFEGTFFELLRLQNEITNSIHLKLKRDELKGRGCFEHFCKRFRFYYEQTSGSADRNSISDAYKDFYDCHGADVGHYFRSLYNIVKFVDRSDVLDKRLYTNLIRAQLSNFELTLIFYNCLSDFGSEKFKPLVEEYSLLKSVPISQIIDTEAHMKLYDPKAFV